MNENDNKAHAEAVCPSKLVQLRTGSVRDDLLEAREKLAGSQGPEYWRSLEELAGSEDFKRALHREFPKGASEWLDPVSRRGFLKLMGASMALAGLTSCVKQPLEPIVPYVRQPEELVLGKPMFYATAMPFRGYGIPVLVTSHEGRPTKIEGNPEHPAVLGGSDIFSQASILQLYDPDRSQTNLYRGEIRPWMGFLGAIRGPMNAEKAVQGAGLRILTQTVSSPTLAWQIRNLLQKLPQAKWHQWEPCGRDNVRAGAQMAFGHYVETRYNVAEADVILSLDADIFNAAYPGTHRYAREWASRRRADASFEPVADVLGNRMPIRPMSRMYMLETTPTITGAKADHRLCLKPSDLEQYARTIAARLGIGAAGGGAPKNAADDRWINALVKELQAHRGTSVVIAGDEQPPVMHALAHAMNDLLGNAGKTVVYTDPVEANPVDQNASIKELVGDMNAGKVDVLVVVGGNPVYDAPADLDFAKALQKVQGKVYHGLYVNETAALCDWHINGAHYLEAWSDTRAYDGTASIVQPLVAPLYGGKSEHEMIGALTDQPDVSGYDIVRSYWRSQFKGSDQDFAFFWRKAVHDGMVPNTAAAPRPVRVNATSFPPAAQPSQAIEVVVRPDPSVFDGRFANNAWLQELPKPMTKLTWDNPVLVGPAMALRNGWKYGDVLELDFQGRKVNAPVWVQVGQPDNSLTVFLGYGRTHAGRAGNGMGYNAYALRTSGARDVLAGVQVRKSDQGYKLITTQGAQDMENRHVVRAAKLDEYQRDPEFAHRHEEEPPRQDTLYPNYQYTGYAWGMAIDQNACVGCNACIIACQAENNIPVVGKLEVARGRHMHWLRVDTYYQGDPANPKVYFQPLPCMQCENAPCELVCPVAATEHDTEGLNDMVYNRCVGTRYCSNNCPYKVRRFNFLLYQDWNTPQYKMMRNPDVSVRSRGVMEKCSYCVQRIVKGRIKAEEEDRLIRDLEVQTACQQACPADAIVFGNINDRNSRVAKLKEEPLNYGLLADLNTRPRTTYLAVVHNPNAEVPEPGEHES